ncbi:hypothetical protein GCM10009760_35760 [Kitasatospora kazusensis]|uniref:SUKH-3 immunity protein of toxin-antitoxin system n=1 Tax=Kitasatospora kazusensis TaxID=407974 RepID=A0ABP5LJK5_9ACTN
MPAAPHDPAPDRFVPVGERSDLDRLLAEYGLAFDELRDRVVSRTPPGVGGVPGPVEYLVHESVLRPGAEFPCAGDDAARRFCSEIADELSAGFGIGRAEAVGRVNRHWSGPGEDGRTPRTWIVGLDIAYHEDAQFWAGLIYYGTHWWAPGETPVPLPPP